MYTWTNLLSTDQIHLHHSCKQLIRTQISFLNETHEHPNSLGLLIAASLSACKSSSWCNSHCTTCLHLQHLLRGEAPTEWMFDLKTNCHAGSPLCGCIGWDEIHNMFAPLFKSNLHLQPWRVTSYESLSLSEPQSVPKATSLSLAITPDEQGTPCTLLMSGLGGLERRHLHKENNDTGAAAIGKVPFNSTGIKINFGTFLLP